MKQQNQYFLFELDGQRYAMEISVVEKVIHAVELISLPETPDSLLGLINVGGKIIPFVNIRKKFNLPAREMNLDDRIIISRISTRKIAFIADNVEGLVEFSKEQIDDVHQSFPEMERYIVGVGRFQDNTVLIIAIDKLFSTQNINRLEKVMKEQD
ncbi:MAG: purine-binding chemotaxis protein CheW [Desulfobacterales bacterium]|uniref:Purine-binding chemotaxis protein CheW n=1 Tax=Candidatus Desulfatibia vada TaxID=2841696 RepID=A0A8J6NUK9_9BACT|nr:purine-binding chemotaxis protein CheW [Candidatus Desulfatibia vada]